MNPFSVLQKISFRYYVFFLFLLWLAVQVALYLAYGVVTSVDSPVYIADAEGILSGVMPGGRTFWYMGYSAFLALVFYLGGGLADVVLWQVLFSGAAAVSLYSIASQISRQRTAALLAVLLYIMWLKIHQWNFYIYSESFFTSMCLISFALLLKCKKPWHYVPVLLLLVFTVFIRPTGFGFFAAIACYFLSFLTFKVRKGVLIGAGLLVTVLGLLLVNKMLEKHILIESYMQAEIIYPNISLGVEAPADLTVPPAHYPQLLRMFLFVVQNPVYFTKISAIKLFLFLGNVKPYFSLFHNLLIVLVLWPLYYFAYRGFRALPRSQKELYFLAGFILTQVLTVTLTTENWDGRFLVPVLPFVFILSATGITRMIGKKTMQLI